jgi:hypothetical protein
MKSGRSSDDGWEWGLEAGQKYEILADNGHDWYMVQDTKSESDWAYRFYLDFRVVVYNLLGVS